MSPIEIDDFVAREKTLQEIREIVSGTDSNLIKHAAKELELIGEDPLVVLGYLQMIQIFSKMGHSGGSASVFIPTLNRLLNFKNLAPLTNDPNEWTHHTAETWGEPGGVWQSNRDGEAFSNDGGKTYTLLSDRVKAEHDKNGKRIKKSKRKPIPIYTSENPTISEKPIVINMFTQVLPEGDIGNSDKVYVVEDIEKYDECCGSNEDPVQELSDALRLTVEYVGMQKLPPIPGWSWYDALSKYAPSMALTFKNEFHKN